MTVIELLEKCGRDDTDVIVIENVYSKSDRNYYDFCTLGPERVGDVKKFRRERWMTLLVRNFNIYSSVHGTLVVEAVRYID